MAETRVCAVEDCHKTAEKRGWCNRHYRRWRRNGDPTSGRTPHGEPRRWIEAHKDWDGEGCLTWPFARTPKGYAFVGYLDGETSAIRVMCERAHGPPPTPKHQAAHSCGKGHEGCIHPGHLRWATVAQNRADMVEHGTAMRGSKAPGARLTEVDVVEIRKLLGSEPQAAIARRWSVDPATISDIACGRTWGWLD